MQSTLQCFRVGVVLFSLAPPTLSFSRGASQASCQEMTPGHIRAQPLDPQHSHVTLRTSASSYLPGQLVTVTVRSSRDFMGFLLQVRSVDGAEAGFQSRTGAAAGVGSTRWGPVLMGGSWTLTPPGTHTLRCLSEGDTLTHSDKQLKRNLSFAWRAPDTPMGDVRFYITVVQSYFVYWAGIESRVVRDGSRSPWSGSNITRAAGGNSVSALRGDEGSTLPALRAHPASNKQTVRPASTQRPPTAARTGTQRHISQLTPTEVSGPVLDRNRSVTLASSRLDPLTNQAVSGRSSPTSRALETDIYVTLGSISSVSKEAGSATHTKDPRNSPSTSNPLPFATFLSTAEAKGMDATTTTPAPNITVQNSTATPSFVSISSLKYGEMDRKPPNVPETKGATSSPATTTTAIPTTSHSFHSMNPPRSTTSQNSKDQTTSAKLETQSSSLLLSSQNPDLQTLLHSQTSSHKPFLQVQSSPSKTVPSQTLPFSQAPSFESQTSSPNLILPFKSITLQPSHTSSSLQRLFSSSKLLNVPPHYQPVSNPPERQTENSPSGSKTTPTAPLSAPPQPQPLTSFPQVLPQAMPTQTEGQAGFPQTDESETSSKALSTHPQPRSQPHFQTGALWSHTIRWKQTQTSVTLLRSISPLSFTRFDPMLTLGEGKEDKDLQSKANTETTSPIFASISTTTPSPSFSVSPITHLSRLHLSTSFVTNLPGSSLVYTRSTTRIYPIRSSTQVSKQTYFDYTSSSSTKNHPKTAPALSALPTPSPISIPPHFSSVKPSSTIPFLSPFQSSTSSSFSSPSSYAISPALSSSTTSSASPPSPPHSSSSIPTSALTSSTTSSSLVSTSLHPEPSPAPRRSLHQPPTSTSSPVPSQQLTQGQTSLIQSHRAPSDPEPKLNPPTSGTVVHPNPEPHPNLDPNFKLNLGRELKPNTPSSDTKPKRPSKPSGAPDKGGTYPDIIPRHSAWELGMLLGCSAGLGMVLVVGVRYVYRQACGKQTEVTLNDREREYSRGERGLIHVQECGDLVRVRRIRENSFVLLAEYDILASPGD